MDTAETEQSVQGPGSPSGEWGRGVSHSANMKLAATFSHLGARDASVEPPSGRVASSATSSQEVKM